MGRHELCPEAGCPFWEPGGAVLAGRCAFERLDLSDRPEVARELLRLRELLAAPASASAQSETRHLFHRLLNESEGE